MNSVSGAGKITATEFAVILYGASVSPFAGSVGSARGCHRCSDYRFLTGDL